MPIVATGAITIVDVNDGFVPFLTNDSAIVTASADGTVASFVGAETQFKVMEAGRDVTEDWSFYVAASGGGISYRDSDDAADRTAAGVLGGGLGGENIVTWSEYNPAVWLHSLNGGTGNSVTTGIDDPFGGTGAIRYETNGTVSSLLRINNPGFAVVAGETYTVSFWCRANVLNGDVSADWSDTFPSGNYGNQLQLGRWTRVKLTGSIAANATRTWVDLVNNTNQILSLDFFGVQINKGTDAGELVRTNGSRASGTRGYLKITALSQDLSYLDIAAIKQGQEPIMRRFSVAKVRSGETGPQGPTGTRGTITTARAISGSTWSDSEAATAISDAGGGSPLAGDVVTLFNNSNGFSQTRVRAAGGTWTTLAAFFGGNVLVDGTLAASKLVSGTITADKLAVGTPTNFIWNSCCAVSTEGWSPGGPASVTLQPAASDYYPDWLLPSHGCMIIRPTGNVANNSYNDVRWIPTSSGPQGVPVREGDKVALQFECIPKGGLRMRIVAWWQDANGVSTLAAYEAPVLSSAATSGTTLGNYTRVSRVIGPAPAGTTRVVFSMRVSNETGAEIPLTSDVFCVVTRAGLSIIHPSATVAPEWAPGGMTDISGGMLRNNAVVTRHLASDSVTSDQIVAGAVSTAELAANAVTANKMVLGDFFNRVEAPTFINGTNSWGRWTASAGGAFGALPAGFSIVSNAANAYIGDSYLSITAGAAGIVSNANVFPVMPGDIWLLRATARAVSSPNADLRARIQFYAADFSTVVAPAVANSGNLDWSRTTDTGFTTRALASDAVVVPAGAAWAAIEILPVATITTGEWRVGEVFCAMRSKGELIVDGSISAQKIAAQAVTASKVMIGEVSNTYPDYDCMDASFYSGDFFTLPGSSVATAGRQRVQIPGDGTARTVRSGWFTVEPLADYTISGVAYASSTGSTLVGLQLELGSMDSNGVVTATRTVAVVAPTTSTSTSRATAFVTVAASERVARFVMTKSANTGASGNYGGFVVRRRATGELIVDGAVTVNKLAAGSITAEKMAVGTPNNVIWNSTPGLATDGWGVGVAGGSGASLVPTRDSIFDPAWILPGYAGMALFASSLNNNGYVQAHWAPDGTSAGSLPCIPGDRIEVQSLVAIPAGFQAIIYCRYLNNVGAEIGVGGYTVHNGTAANGSSRASYAKIGSISVAPANTVAAMLILRLVNVSGLTATNAFGIFTQMAIGFAYSNQTELSLWSAGGTTQISGAVIRTGSLDTRVLAANSIVSDKIATGAVRANHLTTTEAVITGTAQIASAAIESANIKDLAVDNAKIANLTIASQKIGVGQVTRIAETGGFTPITNATGTVGLRPCIHQVAVHVEPGGTVILFVKAALSQTAAPSSSASAGGGEGAGE